MRRHSINLIASILLLTCSAMAQEKPAEPEPKPRFSRAELMVPMHDGTHLQTVIFRPLAQSEPLPILMQRTPYGVPTDEKIFSSRSWKELLEDGYIVVF